MFIYCKFITTCVVASSFILTMTSNQMNKGVNMYVYNSKGVLYVALIDKIEAREKKRGEGGGEEEEENRVIQ